MVNSSLVMQHRAKVLDILRSSSRPVPVKILTEELGISRVALWKLVRKLLDIGYPIQSGKDGYLLPADQDPDLLCPWELGPYGQRIEWVLETSSTMEVAKNRVRPNAISQRGKTEAPSPTFLYTIAEMQTAGRGRFYRPWESGRGGIYLTVSLYRKVPLAIVGRYPLMAAAVLADTLYALFPRLTDPSSIHATDTNRISLKWPNDILVGKRKLGGILLDMEVEGDAVSGIHLGIGVNVRNRPKDPHAVSLIDLMGQSVPPRRQILLHYLKRLEQALEDPYLKAAIPRWKNYSDTLGKPVRIRYPGGSRAGLRTLSGTAVDLGPGGELLVRTSDGSIRPVSHGDCHHRS